MTTVDFVTELFCRIDNVLTDVPKHTQSVLYPSEVATIAFGQGTRLLRPVPEPPHRRPEVR